MKSDGPSWGGREPYYWRDRTRQAKASPLPPRRGADGLPLVGFLSRARPLEQLLAKNPYYRVTDSGRAHRGSNHRHV